MKASIKHKLFFSFGFTLLVIISLFLIVFIYNEENHSLLESLKNDELATFFKYNDIRHSLEEGHSRMLLWITVKDEQPKEFPQTLKNVLELIEKSHDHADENGLSEEPEQDDHSPGEEQLLHEYYEEYLATVESLFQKRSPIASDARKLNEIKNSLMTEMDRLLEVHESHIAGHFKRMESKKSSSSLLFLIIFIVSSVIILFLSIFLGNRITNPLNGLVKLTDEMAKGNLTRDFMVNSTDEVGILALYFNNFIKRLKDVLGGIKSSTDKSVNAKKELERFTRDTFTNVIQIVANGSSVQKEAEDLILSVDEAAEASKNIVGNMALLKEQTGEQNHKMDEASGAIAQMIAAIDQVAMITERKSETIDHLAHTTRRGRSKLLETNEVILEINNSIDSIMEMTDLISSIASQTNLLSMNAAIEAAHAGNSGKGFAVVADQIRDLAETTGENSTNIARVLKNIIDRIKLAVTLGEETNNVFVQVDGEVNGVVTALGDIFSSTKELQAGGQLILNAVTTLKSISGIIHKGSEDVNRASAKVAMMMGKVHDISQEVKQSMDSVNIKTVEISKSMSTIKNLTNSLGESAKSLSLKAHSFKTE